MLHSAFFGELLGCLVLILLGGGVVAGVLLKQSKAENSGWIVITTGWGFAVMMGVFIAQAAGSPQADINPAVTLAKYLLGGIYPSFGEVLLLWIAQVIGCFLGAVLVWLAYYSHWKYTDNAHFKLMIFSTYPALRHKGSNFVTELIATTLLIIFVGALISYGSHLPFANGSLPYVFGFAIWGIGLSLGGPTGYAINPARDLGPRIAHAILPIQGKGSSDWNYAWVPILAPLAGAVLGFVLIRLFMF
ncbi:MIP/aquaporin family protein [Cysteiniphilum halobium]|uniref:MIP/aquaporin family protein n=1 Tax=Cysteiniphilum halobium TaxID=2219059 RepID=UPI000E65726E|nr:MIP/aquaporin family protein [Cysteiniphilum halobium]